MSRLRFPLEEERRRFLVRRSLSMLSMGLLLFVGSLVAMRLSPRKALVMFGAAGAFLVVLGLRRMLLGARPLLITDLSVWLGRRALPLRQIDSVTIREGRLVLGWRGRSEASETLADPGSAAAEIARRAGLTPIPNGGKGRWERRDVAPTETRRLS